MSRTVKPPKPIADEQTATQQADTERAAAALLAEMAARPPEVPMWYRCDTCGERYVQDNPPGPCKCGGGKFTRAKVTIPAAGPRKADAAVSGPAANVLIPAECVSPTEATALATGLVSAQPLTPYNPFPGGNRRIAASIDPQTKDGQRMIFRALATQDHRAEDVIGQIWPVTHWVQHDAERADEKTGELSRWVRTVLICEDGTRISCGSDGVIGSIMSLEAFFGKPPWSPAKMLSIETGKSRAGYTYYTLDVH